MDLKQLASNLEMEADDFIELVGLFIETSRLDIGKLENAIASETLWDVAAAAHSIKGASANLGFNKVSALAEEIEMKAKADTLEGVLDTSDRLREEVDAIAAAIDR